MNTTSAKLAEPIKDHAGKSAGSTWVRWPRKLLAKGRWIQVPTILLDRCGPLKLEPRHIWLLLLLKSKQFPRRGAPRYFWKELGKFCGKSPDTVRKWAYELQRMGLLTIKVDRRLNPDEEPGPGRRNERNWFFMDGLDGRLVQELSNAEEELAQRNRRRRPRSSPNSS